MSCQNFAMIGNALLGDDPGFDHVFDVQLLR